MVVILSFSFADVTSAQTLPLNDPLSNWHRYWDVLGVKTTDPAAHKYLHTIGYKSTHLDTLTQPNPTTATHLDTLTQPNPTTATHLERFLHHYPREYGASFLIRPAVHFDSHYRWTPNPASTPNKPGSRTWFRFTPTAANDSISTGSPEAVSIGSQPELRQSSHQPVNNLHHTTEVTWRNLLHLDRPFHVRWHDVRSQNIYMRKAPYYSRNLEGVFPAPGNTYVASARFSVGWGPVTIQADPTFIFAENDDYMTFPVDYPNWMWRTQYLQYFNLIDRPERYRDFAYARVIPGNSFAALHIGSVDLAVSTQNVWWGPGYRHSLLLSNNAEGFLHGTIKSNRPIVTPIGAFEFQAIWGKLENSGQEPIPPRLFNHRLPMPYIEKEDDWRFFQGLTIAWQPRGTPGLSLGAARTLVSYKDDIKRRDHVFSFFRSAFHAPPDDENTPFNPRNPDLRDPFDDKFALYIKYVAPVDKFEIYAEWARNARPYDWDDFWEFPEHGMAWIIGMNKFFDLPLDNTWIRLSSEFTQLEKTNTWRVRHYPTWYQHPVVRHGYTHRGQILGAGIGPGSNAQYLGVELIRGMNRLGTYAERAIFNNDIYYIHFETTRLRHWVDLTYGFEGEFNWRNLTVIGHVAYIRTLNYWYVELTEKGSYDYKGLDWWNRHWELSIRYRF